MSALTVRFAINGLVAAGIHFSTLYLLVSVAGVPSAGSSNLLAAIVGISASFLRNRHFVFRATARPWQGQAVRFTGLYGATALMHGAVLLAWTDLAGLDYRLGFLLTTGIQVVASYVGNRRLVFGSAGE